jgi:hypothetical protein
MKFLINALAIYRLSHALALEDGPGACFALARRRVALRPGMPAWIVEGVECPFCISFWLGFLFYPRRPAWALACSAVTVVIYSLEMFLLETISAKVQVLPEK